MDTSTSIPALNRCVNFAKLCEYVATNPIAAISAIGSFIGGLLILAYLASIQYFPGDISVSSIGFLLAGAAITGTVLTILLALYLVFPGAVYRHILNDEAEIYQNQSRVTRPNLTSGRSIFWLLDIPSLMAFFIAVMVVFLELRNINWCYFSIAVFINLLLILHYKLYKKKKRLTQQLVVIIKRVYRFGWKKFHIPLISGFAALLPWFFILLFVAQYEKEITNENLVWFIFISLGLYAVFANHLVASAKKIWLSIVIAITLLFLCLLTTHQISFIPKMVVRALTFGNITSATLILDEQGCQIASQYTATTAGANTTASSHLATTKNKQKTPDNTEKDAVLCRLFPVSLKWRIGNEFFIDATGAQLNYFPTKISNNPVANGKKNKSSTHNTQAALRNKPTISHYPFLQTSGFSIPSTHVLSWSIAERPKALTQ